MKFLNILVVCFLCTVRLPAASIQIWTPEPWILIAPDTPPVPGPPSVRMVGGRNGWGSGLVVARGNAPIQNPRASISDLRHATGANFPSGQVTIRYGSRDHRDDLAAQHPSPRDNYFHLSTTPLEETETLVVRFTAEIPHDALPGTYEGTITLTANGTHHIPVQLVVGAGTIPPQGEYVSHANYPSSPDSVALRYGVPMWSPEHWQKLEASFRVYRALGQDVLHVPVILRSRQQDGTISNVNHFGSREGMIRFREQDGHTTPDFQVFEQMLHHWREQVGIPQFIVLYVWDVSFRRMEQSDLEENLQAIVTGIDPQGQPYELGVPYPGTPGSNEIWQPVIQGVRDRVEQMGLDPASVLIGIAHDHKPDNRVIDFYNQIDPGIHWNVISHMRGMAFGTGK